MLLSDASIIEAVESGRLVVSPWDETMVQPASVDVTLSDSFVFFGEFTGAPKTVRLKDKVYIGPGQFCLGSTFEKVRLPDDLAARFEGKSSLGRLGLMTHVTAGFIDPGFNGQITVELKNVSAADIWLEVGQAIGQLCFMPLDKPAVRPYGSKGLGSHYQGQKGATRSVL